MLLHEKTGCPEWEQHFEVVWFGVRNGRRRPGGRTGDLRGSGGLTQSRKGVITNASISSGQARTSATLPSTASLHLAVRPREPSQPPCRPS